MENKKVKEPGTPEQILQIRKLDRIETTSIHPCSQVLNA
jgi:hypothetical protein